MKLALKQWMILILTASTLYGAYTSEWANLVQVVAAVVAATVTGALIVYLKEKRFHISQDAVISGLFCSLIIAPGSVTAAAAAAVLAILSKYIIVYGNWHVFNPAAFGIVATVILFKVPAVWWGAALLPLTVLAGLFITWKQRRWDLVGTYFVAHSLLFGAYAYLTGVHVLATILSINLFLMFFMLVEPMTSPTNQRGRIVYGVLAALFAFVFIQFAPQYDHSLLGLLAANLFVPVIRKNIRG